MQAISLTSELAALDQFECGRNDTLKALTERNRGGRIDRANPGCRLHVPGIPHLD